MDHPVLYATERLALRFLICVLVWLCFAYAVPLLWHTLSPFIIAVPVAASLQPLISFFHKKLHINRGVASAIWVTLVSAVTFLALYWFISFAVGQIINAANNISAIVDSIISILQQASDRLLGAAETMPASISNAMRDSLDNAFKWLGEQATTIAGSSLNIMVGVASGLPYALIYANFLILGAYFIANRYPQIKKRLIRGPHQEGETGLTALRHSAVTGVLGYVKVQLLWFILLLALSMLYFQFTGFPYAALIGVFAALLELIPQFGCGVLYVPWAAICLIIGDTHSMWLILIFYIIYSMIRRLLDPKLLGVNMGMSPLLSLIGMFVGMKVGGVVGLILGPILMLVLASAVRARLFDGTIKDITLLFYYIKKRWQRGSEGPCDAGKDAANAKP